jgi:UMF1 family MFS transporter
MMYLFVGDHRTALLGTLVFFVIGLLILASVDEARGRRLTQRCDV